MSERMTSSLEDYQTSHLARITTESTISTTVAPDCDETPYVWGYVAAIIAVVFYGIMFVPVKKFDTGDGLFFQLVMCTAAWCTTLVIHVIRNSPTFYAVALLGGVAFGTGNICVVPIVKCIGLGLGMSVWGVTNMLSGWATGRFGLFGLTPDPPDNKLLNDFGVILAVSSTCIFAMVKSEVSAASMDNTVVVPVNEKSPLIEKNLSRQDDEVNKKESVAVEIVINDTQKEPALANVSMADSSTSPIDRLPSKYKIILGFVLSTLSGLCYGQFFTPAFYVQDHKDLYPGASTNALDYVFATVCGVLLSSVFYFILYSMYHRNMPNVYPRAILPGILTGMVWGIATACFFVANRVLSAAVAFPVVTSGPAILASLIGVFIFGEIKGKRNLLVLALGITVTLTGAVLNALSRTSSKQTC